MVYRFCSQTSANFLEAIQPGLRLHLSMNRQSCNVDKHLNCCNTTEGQFKVIDRLVS